MKVVIDRFEGDFAVCEKKDRTMIDIERSKLPFDAKEGDVLDIVLDMQDNKIVIDREATNKRKKDIELLTEDLWS